MKTYDLKQDSLVVFPTTYAFKLLKKENNSVTEETKDFYASEELKKVQEKLLKETVKNFFATYHFYSCISGEVYFKELFNQLNETELNFKEDKYPEDFTKFVNEVIYKLKYVLNDKPMDISNKKNEDEMLITRYHEVLRTIVDSLVSITGEKDYYSDIIEAEESVISNKS